MRRRPRPGLRAWRSPGARCGSGAAGAAPRGAFRPFVRTRHAQSVNIFQDRSQSCQDPARSALWILVPPSRRSLPGSYNGYGGKERQDARVARGRDDGARASARDDGPHDPPLARSAIRTCSRVARRRRSSVGRAVRWCEGVGRRGKWVVLALDETRGIIVIQPRMTGGFWLVPPEQARTRAPANRAGRVGRDGLVLRREAAGQDRPLRFGRRRRSSVRPVARAGRDRDRSRRPGRAVEADDAADQADADGSEGAGGHRQHLRRRDAVPCPDPSRAAGAPARRPTRSRGCTRRSARSWPRRSRRRGRASTPATARCSGLEGGFLASNAMYGRGGQPCPGCGEAGGEDEDRRPERAGRPTSARGASPGGVGGRFAACPSPGRGSTSDVARLAGPSPIG